MTPSTDDPWKKLVQAAKSQELDPDSLSDAPMPKMSVNRLRERVQALILALTWKKLSLLAALLAGGIFLIIYLQTRDESSTPSIQIESPSIPNSP